MPEGWLREEQAELAVDKLLEAAGHAFVELGVANTTMSDIARFAGCSRGTLYRYFKNRQELYAAFVNQMAMQLGARVAAKTAAIEDPTERAIEAIIESLREVRALPSTAVWFAPADVGLAAGLSREATAVEALSKAFVKNLFGTEDSSNDVDTRHRIRAEWVVRAIVSLLSTPGRNEVDERRLVEFLFVGA